MKSCTQNEYNYMIVSTWQNPLKSGALRQLPDFLMPVTIEGLKAEGCLGAGDIEGVHILTVIWL